MSNIVSFSNDFDIKTTKGIIDKLELSAGDEFSSGEFIKLKNILEEAFAFYTAEGILARRAHSIGELKFKLKRKEIDADLIAMIVKKFHQQGLLDDFSYAKLRASLIMNRKPAGRGFLIADLQTKLVPREIAEKAVKELLSNVSETDSAAVLLEKRRMSFVKFDLETARRKAYNYLSRRAISYRAAKEAFEDVFNKEDFKQG
ncbi:MAG: regulatory protein RecX [candidate division Zixibacteria bacterium]|nr:regulatory protein RecX [candidate division Zixibacteria bacterium]